MAKYARIVSNIEKCFQLHKEESNEEELSFHKIKEWLNTNTKDGITSARLSNLLRKRKQFVWCRTERKIGSNITASYWVLNGTKTDVKPASNGWVIIRAPE